MAEGHVNKMYKVGSLSVRCSKCASDITIPIFAGIMTDKDNPAMFRLKTDADVADYWSHSWAHREDLK